MKEFIGIYRFKEEALMPTKATSGSAGWDVYACTDMVEVDIPPHTTRVIGTGLNIDIPEGWEVQVRSRSGLAAAHSLSVLNSPGTIDSDYKGKGEAYELKIILHNHSNENRVIKHHQRIAQLVPSRVDAIDVLELFEEISDSSNERTGGLGSTGS